MSSVVQKPAKNGGFFVEQNAVNEALRYFGYDRENMTHGFRAMARTMLDEVPYVNPYHRAHLSHKVPDLFVRAYNL